MTDDVVAGRRWSIAPYFVVNDVVATANYYRDKLGFGYDRFWNAPPSFCMVRRNGVAHGTYGTLDDVRGEIIAFLSKYAGQDHLPTT